MNSWVSLILFNGFNKILDSVDKTRSITTKEMNEYIFPSTRPKAFHEEFSPRWKEEKNKTNPSLWRSLLSFNSYFLIPYCILRVVLLIFDFLVPYFITKLVEMHEMSEIDSYYILFKWILLFVLIKLLKNLVDKFVDRISWTLIRIRTENALCTVVYEKSLKISSNDMPKDISSLNEDNYRICNVMATILDPLMEIISILLSFYYLYQITGWIAMIPLLIMTPLVLLYKWFEQESSKIWDLITKAEDDRIKSIKQMLQSIQMIKYSGMEEFFLKRIKEIKNAEDVVYFRQTRVESFYAVLWTTMTSFLITITFSVYIWNGKHIDQVSSIAVINMLLILSSNLLGITVGLVEFFKGIKSAKVIQDFLLISEISPVKSSNEPVLISMKDAIVPNVSAKINLEVNRNDLVIIGGKIGSGKTSLLMSILGESSLTSGDLVVNGKVSYVSQSAWLENDTIKNNVMFGSDYNEDKLNETFRLCALFEDLSTFPKGMETKIGDRGLCLSGGQKIRITLARSLYQDADIYLFDDPFSALDLNVGKFIFQEAICKYLKNKAVILITHQTWTYKSATKLYSMSTDSFDLVQSISKEDQGESIHDFEIPEINSNEKAEEDQKNTKPNLSVFQILLKFVRISGWTLPIGIFAFSFGMGSISKMLTYITTNWAKDSKYEYHTPFWYISMLFGINILESICIYLQRFSIMTFCYSITNSLHDQLIESILKSPMKFFEEKSTGKIMTRYNNDLYSAKDLIWRVSMMLECVIDLLTTICMIGWISPWFLVFCAPCLFYLYYISKKSRVLQVALDEIGPKIQGPIESLTSSSIEGNQTIRAFSKVPYYLKRYFGMVTDMVGYLTVFDLKFDFGFIQVSYLSTLLMFLALICVTWSPNTVSISVIIALIFSTDGRMRQLLNDVGETDHLIIAIERIYEFVALPPERIVETLPSTTWPSQGMIEFKNVEFSYPTSKGVTLQNLNFKILPGQKIGIAGRTGSGKSTLFKLLMRIVEQDGGEIIIDDVDINKINLQHHRSRISIIQQDPILFRGTVRENLDPVKKHTDEAIWRVLELCQMKTWIQSLELRLNFYIQEDGRNFSCGERQLFTLARAILVDSKILLLDEATSSVDNKTDEAIQSIIRKSLNSCTMLIIAHRLQTILDCDRILVLDAGKIVEFDDPKELMKRESKLSNMIKFTK